MAGITFTIASGLNDSIFGKSQEPIKLLVEKRAELCEKESKLDTIFAMEKSTHFGEKYTSLTAMNGFMPVGENGAYPFDMMQESYSKFLENMTWKDKFSISREAVDDSQNIDMKKKPTGFITGYYRTREAFGAALFGAGIGGQNTFTYGAKTFDAKAADGKAMFATNHPSILGKKTQSNAFADAFSVDALNAAECAMQDFRGDNNEVLNINPDTIIIPNIGTLKKAVFAAIGADKDPDTAYNGFNYQFGRWNVVVWAYLNQFITSGTSPWILCDSRYNKENGGAIFQDRTALEIKSHIDEDNDANVWNGYARFTAGFHDWRAFSCGGISSATQLVSGT